MTRRLSFNIVFRIEDKNVPADYFMAHCWDYEADQFRKILEEDDGYITVIATGVDDRRPKEEFRGSPEYWVDGKLLVGRLQAKR